MMDVAAFKRLALLCGILMLAFGLSGCGNQTATPVESSSTATAPSEDVTDELIRNSVSDAELHVFQMGDETLAISGCYPVDIAPYMQLDDGGFYRAIADVTYLNGGVAGYVDYPEINQVKSCEAISPLEIGLPSIEDEIYGVVLIGDYADGDVLVNENGYRAVWKDGAWIYRYDRMIGMENGTQALVREGITKSNVQTGVDGGTISCEDYFYLPTTR